MSIKFAERAVACVLSAALFSIPCFAQQPAPASNQDSSPQGQQPAGQTPAQTPAQPSSDQSSSKQDKDKDKSQDTSGKGKEAGTSNDRLFYTLPNFLTLENTKQRPPLTTKEKYAVVFRGSFDYVQFPWYAFLSGISQAQDSEPGYGQGAQGYGKRFGAAFADGTIENFLTGAILPSLLREDPRYFQSGHGSFGRRTLYAMSRNLITRTDRGTNELNYSEVVGGAISAAISTYSYHPRAQIVTTTTPGVYRYIASDRTLENTAKVWASQYGYDTLTLVVKEFWPDIHRKLSKKHRGTPEATGTTP